MKWMWKILLAGLLVTHWWSVSVGEVQAARFYQSQDVFIFDANKAQSSPYVIAQTIVLPDDVEVDQDASLLGSEIEIEGVVSGNLQAATGRLELKGSVGGTGRVVANEVRISGEVEQDLVLIASRVVVTEDAVVSGDLVFVGGQLDMNGTVAGRLISHCACDISIEGQVGAIEAFRVNQLRLAAGAEVNGPITYRGPVQIDMDRDARVTGSINWQTIYGSGVDQRSPWTSSLFYGLISSLVFGMLLWLFAHQGIVMCLERIKRSWWPSLLSGLAIVVLMPLVATLALLPSIWLGVAMWLLYLLIVIVSVFGGQVLLGWWLLQWWHGREKQPYEFDWRSVVVGCLAASILLLVPVIGVPILVAYGLICLGSVGLGLLTLRR